MIWLGKKAERRSLVGKFEVSRIWIIVIFVVQLNAWLLLGLSEIHVKSEGAEAIARFAFIQIAMMQVKEKMRMCLCLICGSLLYDSVGILTEFKVSRCNYVRLRKDPYRESYRCDTGETSTSKPLAYVIVVWLWIEYYDIMAKEPSGCELCFVWI